MHNAALRSAIAGVTATLAVSTLAAGPGTAGAAAVRPAHSRQAGTSYYRPYVLADGAIPWPPWWHGTCDGNKDGTYPGSHSLGASWDGLVACGLGPNEGGSDHLVNFYPGSWGEYEWECVELSMRWMYLAWGVPPYGANGAEVADNYAANNPTGPKLDVFRNGTKGVVPQPGDILELKYSPSDTVGHTEVVARSSVNVHGDGRIRVITENLNSPTTGWYALPVSNWVVDGRFATVVDWLHNPHWSLEEPLVSELDSSGNLSVKVDTLGGVFTDVASDVAQAVVIGGSGFDPAPILVVRTTSGTIEARDDVPGAPWWTIATGATELAATSGEGSTGQPTIGWLTRAGKFYVQAGGFSAKRVLEASGVSSIALGSDSTSSEVLMGFVTPRAHAYMKVGSGGFTRIATGVQDLVLAGDGSSGSHAVEGYVGVAGRAFVRQGLTGHFHEVGPVAAGSVTQIAVASVRRKCSPLIAYLTSGGQAYAEYRSSGWLHEASGARAIAVAGGHNHHGFPIFAVKQSGGSWMAKEGTLWKGYVSQGSAVSLGIAALVVS